MIFAQFSNRPANHRFIIFLGGIYEIRFSNVSNPAAYCMDLCLSRFSHRRRSDTFAFGLRDHFLHYSSGSAREARLIRL